MTRLPRRAPARRARAPPGPEAWAPLWRRRGRSARPHRSRQRATDARTGRVACTPDVPLPARRGGRRSADQLTSGAPARAACRRQQRRPCPPSATRGALRVARRPIALRLAPRSAADRREHAAPTGLPLLPPSRPHPPPPAARGTRVFADPIRIRSTFVRKLLPRVRFDFDVKRKPAVTAGTGWHLSFGDSTHFDLAYARASASSDDTRRMSKGGFLDPPEA